MRNFRPALTDSEVVLREQILFIQSEIACDRSYKSAIEGAARKSGPIFILQRF